MISKYVTSNETYEWHCKKDFGEFLIQINIASYIKKCLVLFLLRIKHTELCLMFSDAYLIYFGIKRSCLFRGFKWVECLNGHSTYGNWS